MNKTLRNVLLGGAPIWIGALTVLVQGTATHVIDPWVLGNAIAAGCLTAFLHFATTAAPVAPPQPPAGS